ncbi:MAG: Persistence and stress-resistance antitoxin PasI [Pseudomonadota bacterium]|jgi:putative ubiquitin-RnfH superfamily antitoxin RatB of RatAB toxin-antitoxin module
MTIRVEVAYALPERQEIVSLDVEEGCSLNEAILRSGILERFPEIDIAQDAAGVFGQVMPGSHILREGDRVEIYRPLTADPRIARRVRSKSRTAG